VTNCKKDQQIVTEPIGELQLPENTPKMKPFTGKLAKLHIQPDKRLDLKPVLIHQDNHSKSTMPMKNKTALLGDFSQVRSHA
jgi:hypothetical protein